MKYYLIALLTYISINLNAQSGRLYNADNQLSSSFVSEIFQDQEGYIWVATRNGLNRYDGYQFVTFKKNSGNNGLNSNYINCVCQDRKGLIYIGTNQSIQSYQNGKFTNIPIYNIHGIQVQTYINSLLLRRNGDVIAATSGYGVVTIRDGKANTMTGIYGQLKYIRRVREDHQNRIWIITDNDGVYCVTNRNYKGYFTQGEMKSQVRDICVDKQGNVWLATFGQGLYVMARGQNQFRKVDLAGNLPISTLAINRYNQIMLGCDGNGVYIYDPKLKSLNPSPYYSSDIDLTRVKINSITEDRNGNIWLGMLQKGVYMQPAIRSQFGYMGPRLGMGNVIGSNCVSAVTIDSKKLCWIGTDKDGLYLLDQKQKLIRHYTNVPGTIISLAEDQEGKMWLGSYQQGFGWVSSSGDGYHPVKLPNLEQASIFTIVIDKNNGIWFGTMGQGLIYYDQKTGKVTTFQMITGAENNRKLNSIPNNYIAKVALSDDGKKVFVATSVGLACYDQVKKSWTNVFGGNCADYGIFCRDLNVKGNHVYLGTNDGLYIYDIKNHTKRILTMKDGLPDNGIASIEMDSRNRLWLGTDHGMCCFDQKTGVVNNYFVDRGLQSNEFTDGTSYISKDGRVAVFGGTGGISWFDTERIQQDNWAATVKITNILSGNKEQLDFTSTDDIEFDYADNSFSVYLSTLTYDDPDNITYLYSINGESWRKLQQGSNELAFSHLSPGTYHFRVKAMHNTQSSKECQFTIVVHAPWYATIWAYMLYLILIGLAVWAYLQHRKRQEEDRLKLQAHIHAEEMGEAKLKFFMNISHEIRTPMTLIISPLLQLLKTDHDPHRRSVYATIQRNAERILHLINQLMDLRKIDKGLMAMHMRKTDMVKFVDDVHTLFAQQAQNRQITLKFEHDADSLDVWIDRGNFDKVLVNILSNAFKYTHVGGNITTRLTHDQNEVKIAVSDDGESIPEDKLGRIFERFYQTPTSANESNLGTGIGLDLTRSLVELHYGSIEAHNMPEGKGCEFVVTLPLGNGHLREEEMLEETQEQEEENATALKIDIPVEQEQKPAEENVDINEQLSNRKRQTIVIAEDDQDIANYLKEEFSKYYYVTVCENGKDAQDVIFKTIPSLVISDVMMPVMDGNTLCMHIKNNINTNHIPVILVTAKSREEDKLEGLETGADAYIVKPFSMDILRRTVTNLLHQRELLRNKFNGSESQEAKVEQVKMESPDEKLMNRIMDVINSNLGNSELSVEMIAQEVGLSRVHLYRKMKELTNQTPHGFIRNLRLKQAARLLTESNQNITEVMYACGFNNSASFSTMFKSFYGVSPREYMHQHQK